MDGQDYLLCCLGIASSDADVETARSLLGRSTHPDTAWILYGPGAANEALQEAGFTTCEDGETIRPGHVHIVPQGTKVTVSDGAFLVRTPKRPASASATADTLLQSVAKQFGGRAICMLLPDNTLPAHAGCEAIGAHGGIVAKIGADQEDTSIADIFADEDQVVDLLREYASKSAKPSTMQGSLSQQELREICAVVSEQTGHDFKHYKESTLSRRILRRINILRCTDVDNYLDIITNSPEETRMLMRDLLIGVTAFFRDTSAFAALREKALKPLLLRDGSPPTRIWIAGCGRGHEAYSIAMMVEELQDELGVSGKVQIFATDLDERALRIARKGVYPAAIAQDVSAERLARFFDRTGKGYRVRQELRKKIVFSPHNLIGDPPFSRLDLVSCRNLLIYLGPHLQKKLMSVFHYALNANGYLFLGSSEAVTGHTDLFRVVDSRQRIAQRKDTPLKTAATARPRGRLPQNSWQPLVSDETVDLGAISQRIILDEFAPPYAIVNEDAQIMYLSEGAGNFLKQREGQYVNNIMRMAHEGLRVGLRAAWTKATKDRRTSVYEGLTVDGVEGKRHMKITVQPMPELGEDFGSYMVVFQDMGAVRTPEAGMADPSENERLLEQLEVELLQTREELERSVQDLEAANEEMKSSNEELLSMNEEMQTANEELEASKEEVEAANRALAASNFDLQNFLRSTEIATIFLDGQGCVRNFTPTLSELYNIRESDMGRPLTHFTHNFQSLPSLPDMEAVAQAAEPLEDEALLHDDRVYLRRVTPYQTDDGQIEGMVVTFVDISDQKRNAQQLTAALTEIETLYQYAPVGMALIDRDLNFIRVNEHFAQMNDLSAKDHVGRSIYEVGPDLAPAAEAMFRSVLDTGAVAGPFELTGKTKGSHGVARTWLQTSVPVKNDENEVYAVSVTALDVTEQKANTDAIAESETRLRRVIDGVLAFIGTLTPEGLLTEANEHAILAAGLTRDDVVGKNFWDAFWWNHSELVQERLRKAISQAAQGEIVRYDAEIQVAGGERITIDFQIAPVRDPNGSVIELTASAIDITARKQAELGYARSLESLELALDVGRMGIWDWDLVTNEVEWSDGVYALGGLEPGETAPTYELWRQMVHPDDRARAEKAVIKARNDRTTILDRYRFIHPDGSVVHVMIRGKFFYDDAGNPIRMLGVVENVTELAEADAHRELLIGELNHRVKNSLATIQAMAAHTLRSTPDPVEFQEKFKGRLRAISLAHEMLTQHDQAQAGLTELIERQVGLYLGTTHDRIRLSGPPVLLSPNSAHALGLVLHELATNATKYGALSATTGSIELDWRIFDNNGSEYVELIWSERDGPEVSTPSDSGFGTRLIQQLLEYTLDGSAELRFEPPGLKAILTLPTRADYDDA